MKTHLLFRLIVCAVVVGLIGSANEAQAAKRSRRPLKIGVLVSLTGSWSTLGKNTVAALQIASENLENIRPQYRPARFRFLVRDTQLDPEKALDASRRLTQTPYNNSGCAPVGGLSPSLR
jgi:ABC-type branched-subunit amino acid transport system substrate-binding protein